MRQPLCAYFSSQPQQLVAELAAAWRGRARPSAQHLPRHQAQPQEPEQHQHQQQQQHQDLLPPHAPQQQQLLALVVPHGAACDGFHVAASAYAHLAAWLRQQRCGHLTAVVLGTEHAATTPLALSAQAWATPLGVVPVDADAVGFLQQRCGLPVDEAPHTREHSIENQLPWLQWAAQHGWDLDAAAAAAPTGAVSGGTQPDRQAGAVAGDPPPPPPAAAAAAAATVSIVPISVGFLGGRPALVDAAGAAVRALLQHLAARQQQHTLPASAARPATTSNSAGEAVVLIVTSDLTHAGPFYRELPPPGTSLEAYMAAQDGPVLAALAAGSTQQLLAAAAATRNSMCGLYPLAAALQALFCLDSSSSSSGSSGARSTAGSGGGRGGAASAAAWPVADAPLVLDYRPAHLIFPRPDSTGFVAAAVYARAAGR